MRRWTRPSETVRDIKILLAEEEHNACQIIGTLAVCLLAKPAQMKSEGMGAYRLGSRETGMAWGLKGCVALADLRDSSKNAMT